MKKKTPFIYDLEKMYDFGNLTKEEFLKSYSYLSEEEYEATKKQLKKIEDKYGKITVGELVSFVFANKKEFPKGLETVIFSGDFETNYTHYHHQLSAEGGDLCLAYEMHENKGDL